MVTLTEQVECHSDAWLHQKVLQYRSQDDAIELSPRRLNDDVNDFEATRHKQENWLTFRKREALLSRISIYIVFMFVSCHRSASRPIK